MGHPKEETLALHSSGDLGWFAAWRTERHIARCARCREEIAEFLGDDALQSAGYGLYSMFGKPAAIPAEEKVNQGIQEQIAAGELTDPTSIMIRRRQLEAKERRKVQPVRFGRRLNRRNLVVY